MKILLGAILIVALIVIAICAYKTLKETNKLARTVRRVLVMGCIIVFFNIISLYTESYLVCSLAYSMYFMASDWLLYYFLKFSLEYIGREFEEFVKRKAMIALLVADSTSIVLNVFLEHLYSLKEVTLFGNEMFFELNITGWFMLHYAIVMMLVVLCLISLFYRAFTAAQFYRNKYLLIAVILIVLVIMNVFSVTSAVDVSIIGYVLEAVCIYYCAFVYTPQKLLAKTLFKVSEGMKVGILLFDADGKPMYMNNLATKLLNKEEPLLDKKNVSLEEWCLLQYLDSSVEFFEERDFYQNGRVYHLSMHLQRVYDENGLPQGGYFLINDRTKEIENLQKEQYMAEHDELTGLYNQECFYRKAEKYIKRHPNEELYLICTDIKDFKMVNDSLGEKTGDAILVNFARMLDKRLNNDNAVYGRMGNDIFAIVMPKKDFSEDLFSDDEGSLFAGLGSNVSFPIINYAGVYEIRDASVPVSVMCDRARIAISTIKGDYHKRVVYYSAKMRENVLYEQELISGIYKAIYNEELKMFLQPQMSSDGKMLGAEALVRWFHPSKGQIMPGQFIPVFEKNGLISEVDKYMWQSAAKQLKKWKDEGRDDLYISVNISPKDFYFMNIYDVFTDLVEEYEINPANLKIEITESAIVMDFERQMELIEKLRQRGFIVEMDDFGSGYSSLNMLKDLKVDVLKLDMVFLKAASDEARSRNILEMIIMLSKKLNMPVISEGVETAEQVKFLTEMGCDMFQGYYFAKPMSVEDFEKEYL